MSALLSKWQTEFDSYVFSGYPLLMIPTSEEGRVRNDINGFCNARGLYLIEWDCVRGFSSEEPNLVKSIGFERGASAAEDYRNPLFALEKITKEAGRPAHNIVYLFKDLDDFYMQNNQLRRKLQNMSHDLETTHTVQTLDAEQRYFQPVVLLSSSGTLHAKLANCVATLEYNLPVEEDFLAMIENLALQQKLNVAAELKERLAKSLAGLTYIEGENCTYRGTRLCDGITPELLKVVKNEKAQILKRGEILTYIPEDSLGTAEDVGGFDNFKAWIENRRNCYSREAAAAGIEYPKGVGLLGPPGTCKSVAAKLICKTLGLPGYIFNIGALFGKYVGESEQRVRDAIKQIEAQRGCVVVMDEVDKALGGTHNSEGDSGVSKRVLGSILTWLAEKTSPTFVVMTMNRVSVLPPEFLRSGRFDAIFATDLPDRDACKEIVTIHLRKRGRLKTLAELDSSELKWSKVLGGVADFSGAEIEAAVVEAQTVAFTQRGVPDPTVDELLDAISVTVPLSRSQMDEIKSMRAYVTAGKARPVKLPSAAAVTAAPHNKVSKSRNVAIGE